jgi:hypothetical protein
MMDKNLSWTSTLGEAYLGNPQGVMDAVQQLRQRAQAAGNLKSTPQANVIQEGQTIEIEPVAPDVVYVPEYDPWLTYGEPIDFWPGWLGYPGLYIGYPGVLWGAGIGIGYFGGFGWGWGHWRPNWGAHCIYWNNGPWQSHSPSFWGHRPGQPGAAFGRPPGDGVRPAGGFRPGTPGPGMRPGAFSGTYRGGGSSPHGRANAGGGVRGGGGARGGGGGVGGGGHR